MIKMSIDTILLANNSVKNPLVERLHFRSIIERAKETYDNIPRRIKRAAYTALTAIALVFGANNLRAATLYVDDDAPGLNNGSSWVNAYSSLQDALAAAVSGDEIKVAQGTYKPDLGGSNAPHDRYASFHLINEIIIKGGFAGIHETDPNSRDIPLYESILSGDLNGNDQKVGNPWDMWGNPQRTDNSFHVVTCLQNKTAVLDGFTITGGNADSPINSSLNHGAGMYISESSPTIKNCTFRENSGWSGGMYNYRSEPNIANCNFTYNLGLGGGGMRNSESNTFLWYCAFLNNNAEYGGAMLNEKGSPTIIGCTFRENKADFGGGMYNLNNHPTMQNCTLVYNFAPIGGGICNYGGDSTEATINRNSLLRAFGLYDVINNGDSNYDDNLTLTNCILVRNFASVGGGIYNDESITKVINCILWYNTLEQISQNQTLQDNISYSDIQYGYPGKGNIDKDPFFVELGYLDENGTPDRRDDFWVDGDYHLQSEWGRWDKESGTWIIDNITSPCIDAGDPNTPIGEEPFPNGNRINIGAYGGTIEASKSPPILSILKN